MSVTMNAVCYACKQGIRVTAIASNDGAQVSLFVGPHTCKPSDLRREAEDRGEKYAGPLTRDAIIDEALRSWDDGRNEAKSRGLTGDAARIVALEAKSAYYQHIALSQAAED